MLVAFDAVQSHAANESFARCDMGYRMHRLFPMHVSYIGFMSKQKYINRERDTQKESIDSYILYLLLIITLLKLLETPRWPTKTFHVHSSSNSTANSWSTPKWTTTWLSTAASQPASVTVRMPLFSSSIMAFCTKLADKDPLCTLVVSVSSRLRLCRCPFTGSHNGRWCSSAIMLERKTRPRCSNRAVCQAFETENGDDMNG